MISVSLPALSTRAAGVSRGVELSLYLALIGLLTLGSLAGTQAHPLDSPETVYIDGVPCNGACQSYMAWSRKTLQESSASAHAPTQAARAKSGRTRVISMASPKRAPSALAREAVPLPRKAPRDLTAGLEYLIPDPEDKSPDDGRPKSD
jgi:hypothetical protein